MQTRFWPLSGVILTAIAWLSPAHAAVPGDGADIRAQAQPVAFTDDASEPDAAFMSEAGAPSQLDAPSPNEQIADDDPSALSDFRRELSPYGRWVNTPEYGTVWVPHERAVGANFKPYVTRGRWSLTAGNQWLWNSDYPFGSVVFHYGRWVWAQRMGWSWVPGRRYAHAWVAFRVSSDPFIGWGPLSPSFIWRNGRAVRMRRAPIPYVFAPRTRIFDRSIRSHIVWQPRRVRGLMRRSRYFRPTRFVNRGRDQSGRGFSAFRRGPRPADVGLRVTRSRVQRPSARALGMRRFATNRQASLRRSRLGARQFPAAGSTRARTQARVNRNLRRSARANAEYTRQAAAKRRARTAQARSKQQAPKARTEKAKKQSTSKRSNRSTSSSRATKTPKTSSARGSQNSRRTTSPRRSSTSSSRSSGYRRSSSSRQRSRR